MRDFQCQRDQGSYTGRGKAHQSKERYRLDKEAEQAIRPIPTLSGERIYVHLKPYVLVPQLVVTVGLYAQPKQYADQAPTIGKVIARSEEPEKREMEIGNAQAWYYPHDRHLELWECFLEYSWRDVPLLADENMRHLWAGFELFLTTQFPQAKQIVTPWHDPLFDDTEYETFLRSNRYAPAAAAAYGKAL